MAKNGPLGGNGLKNPHLLTTNLFQAMGKEESCSNNSLSKLEVLDKDPFKEEEDYVSSPVNV